jgi:hypothetical protein
VIAQAVAKRVAAALAGLAVAAPIAACGGASSSPHAAAAPIQTPLATSIETADGSWATVPMGHLNQPLNTFWQLFVAPPGTTARWSNQVQATATATNGGIVLSSGRGRSLIAGVRPSQLLTYSPLIATANDGRSWANGLLPEGLAAHPNALAVSPHGQALALVNNRSGSQVLASTGNLSRWRTLTTEHLLASTASGRACGVRSITAVAILAGSPTVGASCREPEAIGIFAHSTSGWHAIGPPLPSSVGRGTVEVLALATRGRQLTSLLSVSGGGATSLVAVWLSSKHRWAISAPLPMAASERLASVGPAGGSGLFALLTEQSGADRVEVIAGPGHDWRELPPPPPGTETIAFRTATTADAFAVHNTVLTISALSPSPHAWVRTQVMNVSIPFGSSS